MGPFDQVYLRAHLSYEPETGLFRWRDREANRRVFHRIGSVAGFKDTRGRCLIRFGGRSTFAHVLAWLYMTGEWPKCEIDHKNCDHSDNRWTNLRQATRSQNTANQRKRATANPALPKGVEFERDRSMYRVRVKAAGRRFHVGRYPTMEAARAAYLDAARKVFGEFARAG